MSAFSSPEEAVERIDAWLRERNWDALTACYDGEAPATFHERRPGGHPSGADNWTPFPPGWRYLDHAVEGDVARVRVGIDIDQGGGFVQRGWAEFRLRRTSAGWKLLK